MKKLEPGTYKLTMRTMILGEGSYAGKSTYEGNEYRFIGENQNNQSAQGIVLHEESREFQIKSLEDIRKDTVAHITSKGEIIVLDPQTINIWADNDKTDIGIPVNTNILLTKYDEELYLENYEELKKLCFLDVPLDETIAPHTRYRWKNKETGEIVGERVDYSEQIQEVSEGRFFKLNHYSLEQPQAMFHVRRPPLKDGHYDIILEYILGETVVASSVVEVMVKILPNEELSIKDIQPVVDIHLQESLYRKENHVISVKGTINQKTWQFLNKTFLSIDPQSRIGIKYRITDQENREVFATYSGYSSAEKKLLKNKNKTALTLNPGSSSDEYIFGQELNLPVDLADGVYQLSVSLVFITDRESQGFPVTLPLKTVTTPITIQGHTPDIGIDPEIISRMIFRIDPSTTHTVFFGKKFEVRLNLSEDTYRALQTLKEQQIEPQIKYELLDEQNNILQNFTLEQEQSVLNQGTQGWYLTEELIIADASGEMPDSVLSQAKKIHISVQLPVGRQKHTVWQEDWNINVETDPQTEENISRLQQKIVLEKNPKMITDISPWSHDRKVNSMIQLNQELYQALRHPSNDKKVKMFYYIQNEQGRIVPKTSVHAYDIGLDGTTYRWNETIALPLIVNKGVYQYTIMVVWEDGTLLKRLDIPLNIGLENYEDNTYENIKKNSDISLKVIPDEDGYTAKIVGQMDDDTYDCIFGWRNSLRSQVSLRNEQGQITKSYILDKNSVQPVSDIVWTDSLRTFNKEGVSQCTVKRVQGENFSAGKYTFSQDIILPSTTQLQENIVQMTLLYTNKEVGAENYPVKSFDTRFSLSKLPEVVATLSWEKETVYEEETNHLHIQLTNQGQMTIPKPLGEFKPLNLRIISPNSEIKDIVYDQALKVGETVTLDRKIVNRFGEGDLQIDLYQNRYQGDPRVYKKYMIKPPTVYRKPKVKITQPQQKQLSGTMPVVFLLQSNKQLLDNYQISLYYREKNVDGKNLLASDVTLTPIEKENVDGYSTYQGTASYDFDMLKNKEFYIIVEAKPLDNHVSTIYDTSEEKFTQQTSDIRINIIQENNSSQMIAKKGQEKKGHIRISNLSNLSDNVRLQVENPTDQVIKLDDSVTLAPKGEEGNHKTYPMILQSDKIQDQQIVFTATSAYDEKQVKKALRYRVEEQSDFRILPQQKQMMTPVGILSDDYPLQLENLNELQDEVLLRFESETVTVQIDNEKVTLPGSVVITKNIRLLPTHEGVHKIKVIATSQNDPQKIVTSDIILYTRPLIKDQYTMSVGSSGLIIDEKQNKKVKLFVYNTSDVAIENLFLAASADQVKVIPEQSQIEKIEPKKSVELTLSISSENEIEEDRIDILTIKGSSQEQSERQLQVPIKIIKARPILEVNNGKSQQRTGTNIGENATSEIIIHNAGNKEMKAVHIQALSGAVVDQPYIESIAAGQRQTIVVTIPKENNTEIGEKSYEVIVNIDPGQTPDSKKTITINNATVSSSIGALQFTVTDAFGEKQKSGTLKIVHKDLPSLTKQVSLSEQTDSQPIRLEDLMIGTYSAFLLTDDGKLIKTFDLTIKPNLTTCQEIQLDIHDKLFDTKFTVEKINITETYEVTVTTLWQESPPDMPKIQIRGIQRTLKPGQSVQENLTVTNTGKQPLKDIQIDTLLDKSKSHPNIMIAFHPTGRLFLAPGESYDIPVYLSANMDAQSTDNAYQNVRGQAGCDALNINDQTDVRVYATDYISVSVLQEQQLPEGGSRQGYISYKPVSQGGTTYESYQPHKMTKLSLTTTAQMSRDILNANLTIENLRQDIHVKEISIHIQDKDNQDITKQFYQKIYQGQEYTKNVQLSKSNTYHIGWYLADICRSLETSESVQVYGIIHYEVNNIPMQEQTQAVALTLDPLPELNIEYILPNYLKKGKTYEIKTILTNTGNGDAKDLNLRQMALVQGEASLHLTFADQSPSYLKKGETLTLKASITSDTDLKLIAKNITMSYQNTLELDLPPLMREVKFTIQDTEQEAARQELRKRKGPHPGSCINDPIDLSTGAQVIQQDILSLSGSLPLSYSLSYHSHLRDPGENGNGWSSIYEMNIHTTTGSAIKVNPEQLIVSYSNTKKNTFHKTQETDGATIYTTSDDDRYRDTLTKTSAGYILKKKDGVSYQLDSAGKLRQIIYKEDQIISVQSEPGAKVLQDQGTGQFIRLTYNANHQVEKVSDSAGRSVSLRYDDKQNLVGITDANGNTKAYTYDEKNRIHQGFNQNGQLLFENTYDEQDRIIEQIDEYRIPTAIEYLEQEGQLHSIVKDRNQHTTTYVHDLQSGRLLRVSDELGILVENTYDEQGNLLITRDGQGNQSRFTYDSQGNRTQIIDPENNTLTMTYDERGNQTSVRDERGSQTAYAYDDNGKLNRIQNPLGDSLHFTYDSKGLLRETKLPDGGSLRYTVQNGKVIGYKDDNQQEEHLAYDEAGNLLAIEDKKGQRIQMTYGPDGKIREIRDKNGATTTFHYDPVGNLIRQVDPMGNTRAFTWNLYGQLTGEQDEQGNWTLYTYDAQQQLTQVTTADGQRKSYAYDPRGNLITLTDENGNIEKRSYDRSNNLIEIRSPKGTVTGYRYDKNGRQTEIHGSNGNILRLLYDASGNLLKVSDSLGDITVNRYDPVNRLIKSTDAKGNELEYTWDASGRLVLAKDKVGAHHKKTYEKNRLIESQTPSGAKERYHYDELGQIIAITDEEGNQTQLTYDEVGNLLSLTDPLGGTEKYTYDLLGRTTSFTDKRGNVTGYTYDERGDLTQIQNALGQSVHFRYDNRRRLIEQEQAGARTLYQYDSRGNLTGVIDPLGNSTAYVYDSDGNLLQISDSLGIQKTYHYDDAGQLIRETDAIGADREYTYDLRGRVSSLKEPNGAITTDTYDEIDLLKEIRQEEGVSASYSYDAMGRILGVKAGDSRQHFTYDIAGNLKEQIQTLPARESKQQYQYNAKDLLTQVKNARGQVTTLTYDAMGRIKTLREPQGQTTYTYDENGNIQSVKGPSGEIRRTYDALNRVISVQDANRKTIKYTYDQAGNLHTITYPAPTIFDKEKTVTYTYDAMGNIQTVTDWEGRITSYTYDKRGRQISCTRPDGSHEQRSYDGKNQLLLLEDKDKNTDLLLREELTYDLMGNLSSQKKSGKIPIASVTAEDELDFGYAEGILTTINTTAPTMDEEGNLTRYQLGKKTENLRYDSRSRLTKIGETSYSYDSENTRLKRVNIGRITTYITDTQGSNLLIKTDDLTNSTYYIYGNGLIGEENKKNYQSYHFDAQGNTQLLTDEQGAVQAGYAYDPYGKVLKKEGNKDTIFRYSGQHGVQSEPHGLLYMRSRYYQEDLSRFLTADNYQGSLEHPLSLNRYSYVEGNPLRYIDPMGTWATPYAEYNGHYERRNKPSKNSQKMTKKPRPSFTRQNPTKRRGEALLNNLYDTLPSCESLRETGRDFMHGTVDAWDDNMAFGVGQRLAGNGPKPTSKAYYIGKTSADIAGMVLGGVGTFGGLGMMGGGVALDATGAGAIVGVPVTAEGIAVAEHGFIMAGHSLDSLTKDLPALFKQQPGASEGGSEVLENANFAQKTFSNTFSPEGIKKYSELAGQPIKTIDDLAATLKSGKVSPSDLPVEYIVRDGNTLILNTRTSQALTQAGIPRSQWSTINQTGNEFFEDLLTGQLSRNGLTSAGTPTVRPSGGTK